jgi:hypothetical protein
MMTLRKSCLSLIGGVAAFLLVLTPNAFAKHSKTGGRAEVPCGDGTISYSPITLWPPNHKLETIDISFAESETASDDDTIGLQVTGISSNQDTEVAAGGSGCGSDKVPGDNWVFSGTPVMGAPGDDVDPVPTSVQVRAARCGRVKTARVYTIDVTCTDEDTTDSVTLAVTVVHDKGKNQQGQSLQ